MAPQVIGKVSNARSLARFHFVAGLPRSGISVLLAILSQNPRFTARKNGPAEAIFSQLSENYAPGTPSGDLLDDAQRLALWRGAIDAVYHDRLFESSVIDANRDWLRHTDTLVRLYPLSRFIICVRNPAAIVNSITQDGNFEEEEKLAAKIDDLMSANGTVGKEIAQLRGALSGAHAERMLVLDYDRLVDDPEDAIDVVYDFLREPAFTHDFQNIGPNGATVSGPVQRTSKPMMLSTRTILQLSGRAFWRNIRRTSATMMLGRVR